MNSVFTAKLLQNLRNKKGNKGFTLIELLVVVIIIGVLAAIALPNLLGQVAKGRQAEARNTLGTINRSQQAHRLEFGTFGELGVYSQVGGAGNPVTFDNTGMTDVDGNPGPDNALPLALQLEFYQIQDNGVPDAFISTVDAVSIAEFENDILDYVAVVTQNTTGQFSSIICEESQINAADQATDGTAAVLVSQCTAGNEVN